MKTWKIADIGLFFRNSFTAILKGEFLLRLNVGKYFIDIISHHPSKQINIMNTLIHKSTTI